MSIKEIPDILIHSGFIFSMNQLIRDKNDKVIDFKITDSNSVFDRFFLNGKRKPVNRMASEIFPTVFNAHFNWQQFHKLIRSEPEQSLLLKSEQNEGWAFINISMTDEEHFIIVGKQINKDLEKMIILKSGENFGEGTGIVLLDKNIPDQFDTTDDLINTAMIPQENPNPVIRIDRDGKVLYINPSGRKICGYQWGNTVKSEWIDIINESLSEDVIGYSVDEFDHRSYRYTFAPYRKMDYVNVYGMDITDMKAAQEEVISLAKFPSENPNPVLRIDISGRILYQNEAGKALFGSGDDKIQNEKWILYIEECLKHNRPLAIEEKIGYEYFRLSFSPIREGNYVNIYGMNITDRKKAEKALMETQRLKAIGEFASGIAHDFNNSLESLLGYVEIMIFDESTPDFIRNNLSSMKTSIVDAAARVKKLQRFGQTGLRSEHRQQLNMNEIIEDSILQTRPLWKDEANKKGLIIDMQTSLEDLPQIIGDENELRSVLYNILKNCVEAMPKGGTISISSRKDRDFVNIIISDTGIGMDDETALKVFQPFFYD